MPMDEADRELSNAERDASPERFPAGRDGPSTVAAEALGKEQEEAALEPVATASSSRTSHSTSVRRQEIGLSTARTAQDGPGALERNATAMSRIHTARSQHSGTVGGSDGVTARRTLTSMLSRKKTKPLPNFGAGKPYPPLLPDREEYVVEFDGANDPMHAQNWPIRRKIFTGAVLGYFTFCSAFGSSIFSAATRTVAEDFHISSEVGILGVSLYVLGFAFGPILWAPFSELYGRRLPLTIGAFGFSVFNIAVAVGKDVQTVFICRFFSGFFGACPLTVVAAVFADMFNNKTRGIAITVFSLAVFCGPLMAPFIGGFIDINPSLGWRWTEYIVAILGFTAFILIVLFLEETYPPVILVSKAAELRRRTKNWGIHAKQEEIEIDFRELLEKNLTRPLRMLVTEPIVLALSIYMAFIYGLLYLFLTAYPIVFQEIHGFNPGVGGLPFFGMILGELLAGATILILQPGYNKKLAANNNIPVPEWRLPIVIAGGFSFSAGLFWFGWTGFKKDIPWIVPTLSGLCTGFGLMSIFLQCLNYLVDAYLMFAASAIAANTFLRSICGAGFPLFATYMINGLGVQYAGTLLGGVALLLVPLPIIFYLKGAKIRQKSTFAPTFDNAAKAHHNDTDDEKDTEV